MNRESHKFVHELRGLGLSKGEALELTRVVERLSSLNVPGLSAVARERIASRLPVDVEPLVLNCGLSMRWAAAGVFALAVVATSGALLLPGRSHHASTQSEQPRAVVQQKQTDQKLQQQLTQQMQTLQKLQEQPTVDQQAMQKAKDDFSKSYQQYRQLHTQDKAPTDPYTAYRKQWWWKPGATSGQTQPNVGTRSP